MPQSQIEQPKPPHWTEDELDRWKQALFLTDFVEKEYQFLVERSEQATANGVEPKRRHFVLNIDSPWGFGKTFFLDRWKTDLEKADHLVLTFNAWANDFSKDPLLSFLSEISSQLAQKLKEDSEEYDGAGASRNAVNFERVRQKSIALLRNYGPQTAIRLGFFAATGLPPLWPSPSQSVDSEDEVGDESNISNPIVDSLIRAQSADLFQEENARKRAVNDFRDELSALIQSIQDHANADNRAYKLPVFILIDELDRCRPDFTIELIEMVKHIFSVDDIFFVFATDGAQLQASLAGLYGQTFDAELYFKRIFTRELHLKRPKNQQFARTLIAEYDIFREQSDINWLINVSVAQNDLTAFVNDFTWVADAFALTLRDQHQLAAAFDSVFRIRRFYSQKTCSAITLILLVFWQKRKELFKGLLLRPQDFSPTPAFYERLQGNFKDFDASLQTEAAKPSVSSGQEKITITGVLGEFASLLPLTGQQLSRKVSDNELLFGFSNALALDTRDGPGAEGLGTHRPLESYFDQIMMAG